MLCFVPSTWIIDHYKIVVSAAQFKCSLPAHAVPAASAALQAVHRKPYSLLMERYSKGKQRLPRRSCLCHSRTSENALLTCLQWADQSRQAAAFACHLLSAALLWQQDVKQHPEHHDQCSQHTSSSKHCIAAS